MICYYPQAYADAQLSSVRGIACTFGGEIPMGVIDAMAGDDVNIFFLANLPAGFPVEKLFAVVNDTSLTSTPNEQPPIARGTDATSFISVESLPDGVEILSGISQLREILDTKQREAETGSLKIGDAPLVKGNESADETSDDGASQPPSDSESEIVM